MLNTSDTFFILKERLSIIDKNTSAEDKKSIHFKSLRNFICYYDSFKKSKIIATELLNEYLELLERENYSLDKEQSIEAYDNYIAPLATKIYTRYLNFSSDFGFLFQFFLYVVPNYILWEVFHSSTLIISVSSLYMAYWINYIIKYYKHKIYGYRY